MRGARAPVTRFAFVLGNAGYTHINPLRNALNDAENVTRTLQTLNFKVAKFCDLDCRNTWHRLEQFIAEAGNCDAMLLYYCGHGVQLDGVNYIVPVDFDPNVPSEIGGDDLISGLVPVQDVMEAMRTASSRLIFLDACRDDGGLRRVRVRPRVDDLPVRPQNAASRSIGAHDRIAERGLAKERIANHPETFVAFAADPGDVALDVALVGDDTGMSPFTTAVTTHMPVRGLNVFALSQRVARAVREATNRQQMPWTNSNLSGDFCFHEADKWPIWILGGLGLLTGALSALISFRIFQPVWPPALDSLMLRNVADEPAYLLTCVLFGLVLGYGAWRWGQRAWHVPIVTCAIYATVAALCRRWFAPYAAREDVQAMLVTLKPEAFFHEDYGRLREMVLVIILAAAATGAASVFAAAPFVRDMARLPRISMGAIIGALAAAFFLFFAWVRDFFNRLVDWWLPDVANSVFFPLEAVAIVFLFAVWHAALGINVGRAYARPSHD